MPKRFATGLCRKRRRRERDCGEVSEPHVRAQTPLGTLLAGVPKGWTLREQELLTPGKQRIPLAARSTGDAVFVADIPSTQRAVLLVASCLGAGAHLLESH